MTSFDKRLEQAIQRGRRAGEARQREKAARELSEKELRQIHGEMRLAVTEKIEECLKRLIDYFPGFRFETVVSDRGWGSAISRDDIDVEGGRRNAYFSRLEVVVRPYSEFHVFDLAAKGTVRNKELLTRAYHERVADADVESFLELVDRWSVEYAELYAARAT